MNQSPLSIAFIGAGVSGAATATYLLRLAGQLLSQGLTVPDELKLGILTGPAARSATAAVLLRDACYMSAGCCEPITGRRPPLASCACTPSNSHANLLIVHPK